MRATLSGYTIESIVLPDGNRTVRVAADRPGTLAAPPEPQEQTGGVRYYVPYTAVHPETAAATPPDAVWVDVSSSPYAYFGALLEWWARGKTFAVIEHDIVCRPDVVESFEDCPEPWCVFGYDSMCHPECQEAWRNQLGCTRFRAELMEVVPGAMADLPPDTWDWHNVCDGLGANLRRAGFTHHWHYPPVHHFQMMGQPI